ncbi:MAG: cytochrome c [Gammaproteobacteria bacterium]|nr:cytochrome c [Gammaproteobacteria bacterium]MBU1647342.1 cytochrome c [Gammaproteobacteria bacterium]MBU1973134.1 cytochrome c [Gammaproteobacteria bacterium]
MKSILIAVLLSLSWAGSSLAASAPSSGRLKAEQVCAACHGPDGNSTSEQFPRLAGQREAYLLAALRAYRAGLRKDPTMRAQAERLSDQEIADLAAHFGAQTGLTTGRPTSCGW